MTPYLFVYGTLQPGILGDLGARERARLTVAAVFLGPAVAHGTLLDFGGYPGMMAGTGLVHGGVYKLHDPAAVFSWLDAYEGLSGSPDDEYQRRQIPVILESGEAVTASAYVFSRHDSASPVIPSGRWESRRS